LRTGGRFDLDALEAPLERVTIAFAQLVGAVTLTSWNPVLAKQALAIYASHARRLALELHGYIVELTSSGLCLASFNSSLNALRWGKTLVEALRFAEWDAALLEHELCEVVLADNFALFRQENLVRAMAERSEGEMVLWSKSKPPRGKVGGSWDSHVTPSPPPVSLRQRILPKAMSSSPQVMEAPSSSTFLARHAHPSHCLFRGPRVKIGIDIGQTSSEISPCTGRLIYRGRVMNRAARISAKTPSSSCWCSSNTWREAEMLAGGSDALLDDFEVEGWPIGTIEFKGIAEKISIVQFVHRGSGHSQALAQDT
jgi:class 3 adenylate cyclase